MYIYIYFFITLHKKIYSLPERFRGVGKSGNGKIARAPCRMSARIYTSAVGGKWEKRFGNGNI